MNQQKSKPQNSSACGAIRLPATRSVLSIALASALAMMAVPALADDTAAAGDGALAQVQSPDHAESSDRAGENDRTVELGSVLVTANKRVENVREVASSITVLESDQLEQIHATQLTDYANYVPGFQVTSLGAPGQTSITMRGIATLSSGATVGTYLDDTPVGSNGIYQQASVLMLDLFPYDIDHVEVLRGPQGTLYGAGAMGGILKYVMKQPDLNTLEFRVGGGLSSVADGGTGNDVRVGANVPLSENTLGLRASYARNKTPGYIDNAVDGRKNINTGTQTSGRVGLLWQGDAASLKLSAMRQTIDSKNSASVELMPDELVPFDRRSTNRVWMDQPFTKDLDYYAATLDWDLGWADFTSASGYSDIDTTQRNDTTIDYGNFTDLALGLPDPGASTFDWRFDFKQFTQEFRLASKSDQAFEWLVGVFYTRERANQMQTVALTQLDGSPLPEPYDDMFGILTDLNLPSRYTETALFAHGAYRFSDRFKLGFGIRQAKNKQKFSQNVTDGTLLEIASEPGDSSENVRTWDISPQFELARDSMLYAKVASGYQPGGPNVAFPGLPSKVDSSRLVSYEVGLKSLFAERRAQVDLALFQINWTDI